MSSAVLITGVSGGIGRAAARVFHEEGWRVWGVDVDLPDDEEGIDEFVRADVSDPSAVDRVGKRMEDATDRLDALVNNAAVQACNPIMETTPETWDRVMGVNARGPFLLTRRLHPLLHEQGGAIVNVSSVHAQATSTNIAAYASSKGALLAFTRAAALELAEDDIRVNAVLPGAVDTEMLRSGLQRGHVSGQDVEARLQSLGDRHVMGRVGTPREIARLILFLATPAESSFITGQSFVADGGALARLSTE